MAGARGEWLGLGLGAGKSLKGKVKWEGSGETEKAGKLALRGVPGEKAASREWREGAREPERARKLWAR